MAADNHTTIVGNLVEDPELRLTQNGIAVTNLRVAVTQRIEQDGQWRDGDTSFFKVNVWRGQAEHLADSLGKGDRVMVTGRLRQRSWETPEGDKRSVTELEADEVGASLKWATAKVERASQRGNGDRTQGRERQAERGRRLRRGPALLTIPSTPSAPPASVGGAGLSAPVLDDGPCLLLVTLKEWAACLFGWSLATELRPVRGCCDARQWPCCDRPSLDR
jgi:single-strand DNA-binding protein